MTDNEIIKALEHCIADNCDCGYCPAIAVCQHDPDCPKSIALDLINRQKAEVDKWKKNCDELYEQMSERQKAEVDIARRTGKSEAIKEFAERLKERFCSCEWQAKSTRKTLPMEFVKKQMDWVLHEVTTETIDNLVKEMVGDNNG